MKKWLKLRQEKFAQLVAQGIPIARAYVEAGYANRGHGPEVNAFALLNTPQVKARVAEIREMAAGLEITLLTIAEKRRFLAELVRTPVGSVGPDSWLCQEFYEKLKLQKPPAEENKNTETEGDMLLLHRRVKMGDKLRAIELDSKLAGHFAKADSEPAQSGKGPGPVDLDRIREIAVRLGIQSPACAALLRATGEDPELSA